MTRTILALLGTAAMLVGCQHRSKFAIRSLKAAAAAHPHRIVESRLSLLEEHRPNEPRTDPEALDLRLAAMDVLKNVEPRTSEDRRARATAHLFLGDGAAAIEILQTASPDDPQVSSDLAAALLFESRASARVELAIDALAAADRALAENEQLAEAVFNRALALERLGLLAAAREEWRHYAMLDRGSRWRAEAIRAIDRLEETSDSEQWNASVAQFERDAAARTPARVSAVTRRFPQMARTWGEGIYLAKWADGDMVALGLARMIGDALHRATGESLLRDAVATIDGADRETRVRLQQAHRMYRDGRIAFRDHRLKEAESKLLRAETLFAENGSPMELVARYYRGSVLYEASRIDEAEALLDRLAASTPEQRGYRALAAQIGWERGSCRLMRGDLTAAQQIFLTSRRILANLQERELGATLDLLLAQHAEYGGETEEAWKHRTHALATLSRTGNDYRAAVALLAATTARLRRDEWNRAAALAQVASAMAERMDDPLLAAQAFVFASRAAAEQRRAKKARMDLAAADRWIARIGDEKQRDRVGAERSLAAAVSLRGTNPRAAVAELARGIAFYERSGHSLFVPRLLLERARVHRAANALDEASGDVERGMELVERQRETIAELEQRAAFLAVAQALFTEAADLALARGDAPGAFFAVERGRARAILDSFGSSGAAGTPLRPAALQEALADRAAIVVFAKVKTRTVAFVIRRDTIAVVEPEHVEQHLAGVDTLCIVRDPSFGQGPAKQMIAAALGERVLFESPSATLAVKVSRAAQPLDARAPLVVAATVFAGDGSLAMEALPNVAAEADRVARVWPGARVLAAERATRTEFVRAAASASIIHFAGHGVHRTGHPSDAKLLLAPNGADRAYITAGEIARLHLPSTRLVVLNACRTAASSARADGVMNLAIAFQLAGVPDVIAASDDVDDATARTFAMLFHESLRAGLPPAAALREVLRREKARLGARQAAGQYGVFTLFGGATTLVRHQAGRERRGFDEESESHHSSSTVAAGRRMPATGH